MRIGTGPPLIELVEMTAAWARAEGRAGAYAAVVSTGSTSGGAVVCPARPPLIELVEMTAAWARAEGRAGAYPAVVSTGSTSGGPVPACAAVRPCPHSGHT